LKVVLIIDTTHLLEVWLPALIPAFQLGELCQRVHVGVLPGKVLLLRLDVQESLMFLAWSHSEAVRC
jgi:hypothetical protein